MVLDVSHCRLGVMMPGLRVMRMRQVSMMPGFLVISLLMMFGRLMMMLGGLFMMLGSGSVVLSGFFGVRHVFLHRRPSAMRLRAGMLDVDCNIAMKPIAVSRAVASSALPASYHPQPTFIDAFKDRTASTPAVLSAASRGLSSPTAWTQFESTKFTH
jgi:hypothetical protein